MVDNNTPDSDFPPEIASDRDIKPLTSPGARLPTSFIFIAALVGLAVLILMSLFGNGDRNTPAEPVRPAFTPTIDTDGLDDRPIFTRPVQPEPEPEPDPEPRPNPIDQLDTLNVLELERMRQRALLEEQRLKLRQAREAAEREEYNRRIQSSIVLVDRGGTAPTESDGVDEFISSDASPFAGFPTDQDPNDRNEIFTNSNERFLRDVSNEQVVKAKAVKLEGLDTLITQGTFISGITETMINSDLPGLIRAIVDKPVYGRTGNLVLIPKGSRLIGRYQSGVTVGQQRVYIVWTRLERPDGVVVDLGSPGAGPLGQAGMEGEVDNHFLSLIHI